MADADPTTPTEAPTESPEPVKPKGAAPGGKGTPPAPPTKFRELSPAEAIKLAKDEPDTYRAYMASRANRFSRGS